MTIVFMLLAKQLKHAQRKKQRISDIAYLNVCFQSLIKFYFVGRCQITG